MTTPADRRPAPPARPEPADVFPADRPRLFAFGGMTAVGLLVCGLLAYPFLPALAWATALTIMAYPLHRRLEKVVPNANLAAGLSTVAVLAVLLVPVLLVADQLGREAAAVGTAAGRMAREGEVERAVERVPRGREWLDWARASVDWEAQGRALGQRFTGDAVLVAQGSLAAVIQMLVAVFVLFFLLRDARHLRASLRGLSPLTRHEADYLFRRASDSVYATVYATVVTGVLQGATGGLVFWAVGLPAPVLWGVVMTVLAIIPVLGAFMIWVPAAVYLAGEGEWGRAAVVVGWGVMMAGPVCNVVYAWLAGGRMRLHPVPVLVAFVGGLAVFGVSGMVLGPVALAVTVGLIDVWRRRLDPDESPAPSSAAGDWAEPAKVPGPPGQSDKPTDIKVTV